MKGIHLEGLRVLGKPEDFARHYYEAGADELIYMDVVASLYQRNGLLDIVNRTAREIFVPLTVGGGLRTLDDIRMMLRAGADKVCLNTAAINRPEMIKEAAHQFGSSTIVVSIEAIQRRGGGYEAYTDNGRQSTGVDALAWAIRAADLGAGELMVTSIDREGTGEGFDLELTRCISESVSIPVIACGGAGNVAHVFDAITRGKADAVSVASILHYQCYKEFQYREHDFPGEGNLEFRRRAVGFSTIQGVTVQQIKEQLIHQAIPCRPTMKDGAYA